jgi:hypothetical protein
MPVRLDKVTIALTGGDVVIPWDSSEQLIDQIHPLPRAAPVVKAFQGAGTSSPVRLDLAGKELLLDVIQRWITSATLSGLPDGLYDLRNGLRSDIRDGD